MYHHTKEKSVIRLGNNKVLKTLTKTLTLVDADADANSDSDAAIDAEGSTIALRGRCSSELKIVWPHVTKHFGGNKQRYDDFHVNHTFSIKHLST